MNMMDITKDGITVTPRYLNQFKCDLDCQYHYDTFKGDVAVCGCHRYDIEHTTNVLKRADDCIKEFGFNNEFEIEISKGR